MDWYCRHKRPLCGGGQREETISGSHCSTYTAWCGGKAYSYKEPGPNFREDFDKYPVLYDRLERVLCPRVHFKMLVFDGKEVYVGSANLTGAGIGMKAETTRNFEAGILTDDTEIIEQAMNQFDDVWIGKHCKKCKRREFCPDPIVS